MNFLTDSKSFYVRTIQDHPRGQYSRLIIGYIFSPITKVVTNNYPGQKGIKGWQETAQRITATVGTMASNMAVRQAVILDGGKATRLKPYTDSRPKSMMEIAGRCIIDHQLEWLAQAGVTDVIVSSGPLHEVLREHLASTSQPLRVEIVVETEPLGRGGGLRYAGKHLPSTSEPWYALNGDIWTGFSLTDMAAYHFERQAVATLALARPRIPWGAVELNESGQITDFVEAPPSPYLINGGVYLFESEMLDLLPEIGDHEFSTFPELAKQHRLAGFPIDTYWRAIDTAKDMREAAKELAALTEH